MCLWQEAMSPLYMTTIFQKSLCDSFSFFLILLPQPGDDTLCLCLDTTHLFSRVPPRRPPLEAPAHRTSRGGSCHFLRLHFLLAGTMLSVQKALLTSFNSHFLGGEHCHYLHFVREEIEVDRSKVTHLESVRSTPNRIHTFFLEHLIELSFLQSPQCGFLGCAVDNAPQNIGLDCFSFPVCLALLLFWPICPSWSEFRARVFGLILQLLSMGLPEPQSRQ